MKIVEKVKEVVLQLWNILKEPDMLVLPGQLAFFFLWAIVPMVTLIAYGTSLFNVSQDFMMTFITKAFGGEIKDLIMPIVQEISMTPAFLMTICVSFYTASTGASSIIITSNHLYKIKNTNFLHRKIKAILMTLILVLLLVFLLLVPAFGDLLINFISYVNLNETVTKTIAFFINLLKGPVSWILMFLLIKIMYTVAPDENLPASFSTKGALFTTFGFVFATFGYSIFVNNFANYDILYGGLAHFVVLMIWLYILANVVTISLAINSEELKKLMVEKGNITKS